MVGSFCLVRNRDGAQVLRRPPARAEKTAIKMAYKIAQLCLRYPPASGGVEELGDLLAGFRWHSL